MPTLRFASLNTLCASCLLLLALLLWGCGEDSPNGAAVPTIPQDKLPQVELDFKRYEAIFFQVQDGMDAGKPCMELMAEHFDATEAALLAQWLMRGEVAPDEVDSFFVRFPDKALHDLSQDVCRAIQSPGNRQMNDTLRAYLPADWQPEARLVPLFQRYKYFFPKRPVPKVRTAVAGHEPSNSAAFFYPMDEVLLSDDWMFLGIDYFVGSAFPLIHPEIPKYIRRRFDDQYLEVRIARALTQLVQPELPQEPAQPLLAYMLHEGMKYYMIDRMLPELPDSTKMLWTDAQLQWAQQHEGQVYKLMLGELYSAKYREFSFLLEARPFAKAGWDKAAPPMLGHYIGWQIIRRYMAKNPNLTLPQLMQQTDWQRILQESGYKPAV